MSRGAGLSTITLVYRKELRETLRDRRTLMVMILFPLVVYPLMSLLLAQVMASKASKGAAHASQVAVSGPPTEAAALRRLLSLETKSFAVQSGGAVTDVESGRLDALVVIAERGAAANAAAETTTTTTTGSPATGGSRGARPVTIVYDETRDGSAQAHERLEKVLAGVLPAQCRPAFAVSDRSVAPGSQVGGYLLSKVLPLVVVVMVMLGAFYPAIDITAGERERGTLETILASPVSRVHLMTGKVLAVATLAAVTGMLNLISISLTMVEGMRLMGGIGEGLRIPWTRTFAALTMVVPSAFLFASVMVAVGAMARGFKEAQNLLTPIYFLCITPAMVAGLGGYELTGVALVAPVVNVTLLARAIVLGTARIGPALLVIASTLVYGALALGLAARLYDSERLLYSDADDRRLSLRDWLRRLAWGAEPARDPSSAARPNINTTTAADALLLFGLAYVLMFFLFFPLQARHPQLGLLVTEWVGLLGLVAIYARATRRTLRQVLVLERPAGRALLGAALCGLSAWAVLGLLAQWIAPAPRELIENLRRQILPPGGRSLALTILLMAVTPAICEEALFRGPILRGLATRVSPLAAAALTGLLFGLFHFDLWRLVPTGLLGVLLSLIAWRAGSIVPSMLAHAINNGCLVMLAQLGLDERAETLGTAAEVALFATAVAVLATGAALVATSPPARGPSGGSSRRQKE
ncbi:MAG TPA: ABC transporter permease subunit/CPBP intramembrane protease [Polyangia bacterium]|jgi:sodium transport system permease protein|nr:ABC transporter permease subunit/CPBP intramembrane protease [Polyangia bacterium]